MPRDFFTKYAVVSAFVGLSAFLLFVYVAITLFPFPWDPTIDAVSTMGIITDGNYAAGFLATGLTVAAVTWMPVVILYLRRIRETLHEYKQFSGLIGFTFQFIGRVFLILAAAFPAQPWHKTHDYFGIFWGIGEALGLLFIGIEMLRGKTDRTWGIIAVIFVCVGVGSWVPYGTILAGAAIPEFITFGFAFSYSIGLWVRAWQGNLAIGKARALISAAA